MAFAMQPDYIEQDLVLSKDNIPVVIHDIFLDDTTDVVQKFPKRIRSDGRFYVVDFNYNELLHLNVFERFKPKTQNPVFPNRFSLGKSSFRLHSLQDEIELIQGMKKSTGNDIGIYPEIKDPTFHLKNGKDISKIVLKILSEYGYNKKSDNCILQCFDSRELLRIRDELKSKLFLVQLIESKDDEKKLTEISYYADGIGPNYKQIIKGLDNQGNWKFSSLVQDAHLLGLKVHAYTLRADDLGDFKSFDEMLDVCFNKMQLDGVFTDFPDKALEFLKNYSL